jgi:hypothetical protein
MTEYIAYYVTDSGYVAVWEQLSDNIEDDSNVFQTFNVPTLADVVTALGDAGFIVTSDWSSSTSYLVTKATVERVEEWDARNGVISRHDSRQYDEMEHGDFVVIGIWSDLLRD